MRDAIPAAVPFLGFYSLPDNKLHIISGYSLDDVKKRAAESSARNNLTYTNRAMVDLYPSGEFTPLCED